MGNMGKQHSLNGTRTASVLKRPCCRKSRQCNSVTRRQARRTPLESNCCSYTTFRRDVTQRITRMTKNQQSAGSKPTGLGNHPSTPVLLVKRNNTTLLTDTRKTLPKPTEKNARSARIIAVIRR